MTTLSWIYLELAAEAGIPREEVMTARSSDKFRMLYGDSLDLVISLWLSGRSSFPPTWASLYQILRQLGCVELSHQIEDYLASECIIVCYIVHYVVDLYKVRRH